MSTEKYTGYEIAIIGMAGRFPGAGNIQAFWNNLKNGVESVSYFTEEELLPEGVEPSLFNDPRYVKANAFLEDKGCFDSAFFDYRPDEARIMDPQIRVLHECVWHAIEDAGYNVHTYKGRIGLFAGASSDVNWRNYTLLSNTRFLSDAYFTEFLTNVNYANTKISYLLNLRGPSISMNTACSTSLVAVHQACNSLLLGECSMALAGGVSIRNFSRRGYLYQEGMILSRDGHCRAFDEEASGTIGGEGVGIVVLKKLKNALEDKDNILAVIKGTGINNDGAGKVGYTAPGVDGQTEAIIMARRMAKVPPESISYVEAHGTATRLGDPIEVEALSRVFGKSDKKYCALGSVKTNIGHLDVAAGVAGLIKVVLSMQHRQLPPSLHFRKPNPAIEFRGTPFYVNTETREWKNDSYPLRAGVSSFGIGGTNVHVILEEAPPHDRPTPDAEARDYQLLLLSGKTPSALKENMVRLSEYLAENGQADLSDVAYTLQTGRVAFRYRKSLVCAGPDEAVKLLSQHIDPEDFIKAPSEKKPLLVFMFPGQGSQYADMCAGLYQQEPVFRDELDRCFTIAAEKFGLDLHSVVFPDEEERSRNYIDNTEFTQPLLFAVEYSLARLLMSREVRPDMLIGHSLGEYVAACISEVLSLEDALTLVIRRGSLMQGMERGTMLGISIPEAALEEYLKQHHDVSLAAVNSSELSVVAGREDSITRFHSVMERDGYRSGILRTSHAFHSYMMDGILEIFEGEVRRVGRQRPAIPVISNLTGRVATEEEFCDPAYWRDHLRRPVHFSRGLELLLKEKNVIFLEVGPGKTLSTFVRSHTLRTKEHIVISLVRPAQEKVDDMQFLLRGLGSLWMHGIEPDWASLHRRRTPVKLSLPGYAFEKMEYPADVDMYKMLSGLLSKDQAIKKGEVSQWFYAPSWKMSPLVTGTVEVQGTDCVLFFTDSNGVTGKLEKKIREYGGTVISVLPGTYFCEEAPTTYILDPGQQEGYQKLFTCLAGHGLYPRRIVHAWGISEEVETDPAASTFNLSLYSLLETAKAYQALKGTAEKRIILLTNDLNPVLDKGDIACAGSLPLGLLKVLSQEFPAITTVHVDICLKEMDADLADRIHRQMYIEGTGKVISLRHCRQWQQIYEPIAVSREKKAMGFREGGVYLITGGLGSLGIAMTDHLLDLPAVKVILLGRTRLQDISGKGAEEKLRQLRRLERKGEVLYLDCNISDTAALYEAVKLAEDRFGPVNGVIHAAGIVGEEAIRSMAELRKEDFHQQFLPKIKGLQSLSEVMGPKGLDFCIVTSSLSVVLGGLGFGAYASANMFMDYYIMAMHRRGKLKRWICLDLDGLSFDGAPTDAIDKNELYETLQTALAMEDLSRIVVSSTDLHQRLEKWIYRKNARPAPEIRTEMEEYVSPSTSIEEKLVAIWSKVLDMDKADISVTSSFFELGGNSLIAPVLLSDLCEAFDITVPLKYLYQYPTISTFSEYLTAEKQL